jgi:gamma-glutamyltranspeptidase / glutathione hydrolase
VRDDSSGQLDGTRGTRSLRREALGYRGMVVTEHPQGTLIGIEVLEQGGNAFDAAIAVAAAEGVLMPMMCGLGGDAFALAYDAGRQEIVGFNGSGGAPAGATREYYVSQGLTKMPLEGIHSVAVPGALSVYEALWTRYGTRPWAELWAPAIRLAEDGVVLTDHVCQWIAERAELLTRSPDSASQFLPGDRVPAPGDRWASPNLGRSLRAVAEGGADAIYRGELAKRLLEFLKREGAPFEPGDFARQEAVVYAPLASEYRGSTIYVTAPPSQGFLLLEQLNILEGFDLSALGPVSAQRIHLLIEAKKLAFADRNRYSGDPAFVDWPLAELIGKAHAARRRAEIDPSRAGLSGGALVGEHAGDTSYFAVADGAGNAVSFIHSLSLSFGSGIVAGQTGIMLNNRSGRGFSLEAGHPNVIAPGKRPMSTLSCYMACRGGRPWLIGGTPGGDQQTQWNVQVLTNLLDHGMALEQAVNAPRWFSFPGTDPATIDRPMVVRVEASVPESTKRELAARGHAVRTLGPGSDSGAVQVIQVEPNGVLRGATDPRSGGLALGF